VLAGALAALAAADLRAMILPDALTLPLLVAGLAAGAAGLSAGWEPRAAGAAAGWGALAGLAALWRRRRGVEGLGLGDAKLAGAAGAWVGAWELATVALVAAPAAIAAALLRGEPARPIPFGPFLALGFWVALTRCPCLAPA
jgi:leader peptidase (prepilin peptidase)/N-methyltransferase